ncbi:MAG TPA: histidine phosphatase family protein [Blastocatellia bacterium]|nr:histidine phosphatase family protein [Blastocatellia bacterium]
MSTLYLIRHGQAGTRDNYDLLSTLGQQQARHLGGYWATQAIALDAIYTGGLWRQQQTAQLFAAVLREQEQTVPDVVIDEQWNEFSLAAVYRGLAERLCAEDTTFAADYAAMQDILRTEPHATGAAVGRCDRVVIQAWMENRCADYAGDSWKAFRQRVESGLPALLDRTPQHVAVFTSATPIAIWTGLALGLTDEKILSLMGVLYNSGITVFKLRAGELRLLSFNATPHLADPALRTFR